LLAAPATTRSRAAPKTTRLAAERDGLDRIEFTEPLSVGTTPQAADKARVGGERLFAARRAAREGQRAQLGERVAQIEEEVRGLAAQQRSKASEIDYIGEELAGALQLYQKTW
jgi:HlyD family secretion protein